MHELLLGTHLSIAGGMPRAVESAARLQCNALQVFVKNPSRWEGKEISDEEAGEFRSLANRHGIRETVAHSSYLINLASPDDSLRRRSIEAVIDELDRCSRLGLSSLVIHPGSHREEGETKGIKMVAKALSEVLGKTGSGVKICLETTSGMGNSLGYRFEHLRDIISELSGHPSIGVCIDTCHIFTAGYDLRTRSSYEETMRNFDEVIGFPRLSLFHLNDSLKALGSRLDRHQHIGLGIIGEDAFKNLIKDSRFERISKILETPKDRDGLGDRDNLAKLRSFYQN